MKKEIEEILIRWGAIPNDSIHRESSSFPVIENLNFLFENVIKYYIIGKTEDPEQYENEDYRWIVRGKNRLRAQQYKTLKNLSHKPIGVEDKDTNLDSGSPIKKEGKII